MLGLLATHAQQMVWVDETATYMEMKRMYGRAKKGVRVKGKRRRKYRRHTLIVAMSLEGVLTKRLICGGMKRRDWRAFVRQDLVPNLKANHLVQWDNLDLHYDEEALEAVRSTGAKVFYQPAYSPESNPIEEAFSLVKLRLRDLAAKSLAQLREAIERALQAVTPKHMRAYWNHSLELVTQWDDIVD